MKRKTENERQPWKNEGREGRVARRADATDSLIISIAYANLRGETGLDAIRGNYFTLAKWLLLVVEPRVVSRSSAHTVHKVRTERETKAKRRSGEARSIERNGVRPTPGSSGVYLAERGCRCT